MIEVASVEHDIARTVDLLGGKNIIRRPVTTSFEVHDLLRNGLPSAALFFLIDGVHILSYVEVLDRAIGISTRTLQRKKKEPASQHLSTEQSDRIWRVAEILGRATDIFGSREEAEKWLAQPSIGLDHRSPIDLIATAVGFEAVQTYLTRIEYGVYT